jgi:hypothetical protein
MEATARAKIPTRRTSVDPDAGTSGVAGVSVADEVAPGVAPATDPEAPAGRQRS